MHRWLKSALVIIGISLLCGATVERDLESVLNDNYQTELPTEERECPPGYREIECADDFTGEGPCCKEIFEGCDENPIDVDIPDAPNLPETPQFQNFGSWFLVVMVVCIILLLLIYLKGKVITPSLGDSSENVRGIVEELQERVGKLPHEQYAHKGEWDAAIHAMLLRCIVDLFLVQPELDRPATTGREIGYYAKPPYTDDILALVGIVERILFANYRATEDDYRRLVPHFESMTTQIAQELARAEV